MYWITAILYAVILLIILINNYSKNRTPNKVIKSFRIMVMCVIFFCLQDCIWGLCATEVINNHLIFFITSSIFHICTAVTTFIWLFYILTYLNTKPALKKFLLFADSIIILVDLVLVIQNCFTPVLFTIENNVYITKPLRSLTFLNQYLVFITIGILALISTIKNKTKRRKKYFSVFIFTLSPIILGVFQFLYPNGPFYSMGYFFSCFIVHIFIVSSEMEASSRMKLLSSVADIYYSLHILNLKENSIERIIEGEILSKLFDNMSDPQEMLNTVITHTTCEEYTPMVLDFVNLSTIEERMKNKNTISTEFIGRNFGWTRISFIAVEKTDDHLNKLMITTQIIDVEKKEEIKLMFQSNNDELTGLYNRRAYETEIEKIEQSGIDDNLIYISMDLNALKITNDNIGHAAGDELLKGAAECMKKCFGIYGKVFRIGGDEFCALLHLNQDELAQAKSDFDDMVTRWSGTYVPSLSISCGYVGRWEMPNSTFSEIASAADKKMYEDKSKYYKSKGIDRRGQKDAYTALCTLYTKILKINLTEDSYQIILMDANEQKKDWGFEKNISHWLHNFAKSGNVHPEDAQNYIEHTDLKYLKEYFASGKKVFNICYRRKIGDTFKQVIMDIIPANDYTATQQNVFLYVKSID